MFQFKLLHLIYIERDKCTRIIRNEVRLLKKEKSYREHPSFSSMSASYSSSSSLFIHSFIHSSVYLSPPASCVFRCDWPSPAEGPARRAVCFPLRLPSLFYCPLRIPSFLDFIPSGPLSSLVECLTLERVWGTGRSGRRGLWRSGGGEGGETRDRGERMTGERSAGS